MTIEEYAHDVLRLTVHAHLRTIARKRGLDESETQALIAEYDADPMGVTEALGLRVWWDD